MALPLEALGASPAVIDLATEAVASIEERYGPDSDHFLAYHNADHTLDVITSAHLLARARGVSPRTHGNLIIAAAYHDFYHEYENGESEAASADAALTAMARVKSGGRPAFSREDFDSVDEMIHGTVWHMYRGVIIQHANTPDAKLLADADLSKFGSPPKEFWPSNASFFREKNPGKPLDFESMQKSLQVAARLLRTYRPLTVEAARVFPHQARNLALIEGILASGDVPPPELLAA
jgi:predicted metal-dependent HD superfamily phosphohydrolase